MIKTTSPSAPAATIRIGLDGAGARTRGAGPEELGGGGEAGGLGGLVVATGAPFRARAGCAGIVRDRCARVPTANRRVGDLAEPIDQRDPLARCEPRVEQARRVSRLGAGRGEGDMDGVGDARAGERNGGTWIAHQADDLLRP